MCGLVGYIGTREDLVDSNLAETWERAKERGPDSWGWTLYEIPKRADLPPVIKQAASQAEPSQEFGFAWDRTVDSNLSDSTRVVMLGNRRGEPASEWQHSMRATDQQPYTSPHGRWMFVHNGTISNDKELAQEVRPSAGKHGFPTQIDSYVIGLCLDRFGWHGTLRRLEGSFAIIAMPLGDSTPALYAASNYKPLWYRGTEKGIQIASQKAYLDHTYDPVRHPSPVEIPPYSTAVFSQYHASINEGILYPKVTDPKTLVVCSGGLDSGTVAWYHAQRGEDVTLLHINYGCRATEAELHAIHELSYAIQERFNVNCPVVVLETDFFKKVATSPLTGDGEVNQSDGGERGAEYAHEWVPARNTVMLSLALAYAERHGYHTIALGTNQEESSGGFPDNEQEFVNKVAQLAPYALRPGHRVQFSQPLSGRMKRHIVQFGAEMCMPFEVTYSCYMGGENHCGSCGPCYMRQKAFLMAGVTDPTKYETETNNGS